MSVENTPLTLGPTGTAIRIGLARVLDQRMEIYREPDNLPCDSNKREECERHLQLSLGDSLIDDFWLQGCDFDRSLPEGVVRLQLSCVGVSRFLNHCRLTLTQFDKAGNILNQGRYKS